MEVACSKLVTSGTGMSITSQPPSALAHITRVGEDKTNGTAFTNINCYSSSNLVEWNYEGALLTRTASGDTGPGRVIERPKIMFNKQTNKYVLWMHIDSSNYGEAKIGVATGDSVCGKYTYLRSERPLGFESRDSGVYVDDDGQGYLLTEDVYLPLFSI
jgi:sucrose-6-phosphate hydrolase SacC (GH32 family)